MKQEFNKLINDLKIDPKLLISVINASTYNKIIPAKSGLDLVNEYGSIENFFEDSFKKGNSRILVTRYRRNGTGLAKIADGVLFDFTNKESEVMQTNFNALEQKPVVMPPSLNGAHQSVGLGVPELINYAVNASRSQVLEVENGFLKSQNEDLKKQLEALKEERLADKYSVENKKNQNEMILGLSQSLLPMLGGFLSKSNPAPLNAPENSFNGLSAKKQEMIDFVTQPTTLDLHIDFLFQIIEETSKNAAFYNEIQALIQKNNEQ